MKRVGKHVIIWGLVGLIFIFGLQLAFHHRNAKEEEGPIVIPLGPPPEAPDEEESSIENLIAQAAEGNLEPLRAWIATEPSDDELYQALRLAAERTSLPAVRLLVEAGADVNHDPDSPILLLALSGADHEAARAVARYLAEHGADTSWKVQTESAIDASPPELTPCHCLPELCGSDFPPPSYTIHFGPYRYERAVRSPDCSRYYKIARIVDERTDEVIFEDATTDWISAKEIELTGQPPEELCVYVYYQGGSSSVAHAYAWTRDEGEPRNIMADAFSLQEHPILADLDGDDGAEMTQKSYYSILGWANIYAIHIPEIYGYDARLGRMVHKGRELKQVYRYLAAEWYDDEISGLRWEDDSSIAVSKSIRYWALSYRAGRGDEALAEIRKELEQSDHFEYVFKTTLAGIAEILPKLEEAAKPLPVLGEEGAPPYKSERYPYYEPFKW